MKNNLRLRQQLNPGVRNTGGGSQTDATDDWTRYTDPSSQNTDFVYADLAGGDRTIAERREWLEDKNGTDLGSSTDTLYTRNCACGQITEIEYSDGSTEEWTYDSYGNVTKYTRTSSGAENDLVQQWTYDTFANYSRMLTSSGWLRAEASPSAKVTWAWNGNGTLDTVTWPSVTSGQPSSQTIEWSYTWNADGTLDSVTQPNGDDQEYSYDGDEITRADDPGTLDREWVTDRNLMGHVVSKTDPTGATWTYTVTPDGRVLKMEGPNDQETKYEYDLRGRRIEEDQLLIDSSSTRVVTTYDWSDASKLEEIVADYGGLDATTAITHDEANRYEQRLDPEEYGTKTVFGYGSQNLPWKVYNVDDSGGSPVETLVKTYERDTMGRVTAEVLQGGTRVEYEFDGFGRKVNTITELPNSDERETILTLEDWGAVETREVKVDTTTYATRNYYYDEAIRLWKTEDEDPDSVLSDRVETMERDENGRVAIRTDARGKEWETQWDAVGRVSKTIDPIGNEIQYSYSDTNRTRTITHHEKDTSDSTFEDYVIVETRDASGRVTSVKDEGRASGDRTTSYTYDEGGRRTSMTRPLGGVTDWEYDKLGRKTTETVDIDNSQNPDVEAETGFAYFLNGKLKKVTDANDINTEWTYDSFGRELTVKYDDDAGQVYTKTYDSYGRLDTETDPMGVEKDYTFDAGGRMTQVDLDKASSGLGGPDRLVFAFDDMDRVTSGKTQELVSQTYTDIVTVTRAYDGFGQLESETQHGSRTFSFEYDDGGALKEITFPGSGPVVGVRYTFDDNGRVDSVDRKLSTDVEGISTSQWEETATFEYEGYREIERVQAKYDLERIQTWTSFKEPAILKYQEDSTDTLLTGFSDFWDDNGNLIVRNRLHDEDANEWGEVYRYDDMDRLVTMFTDVKNPESYKTSDPAHANYDQKKLYNLGPVYEREDTPIYAGGSLVTPEDTYDYSTNDLYQYTSVWGTTWTWDDNGQLTDNGDWAFEWTALGQLEKADPDSGDDRDYLYDAFGRRVQTVEDSQTNEYVYVGWHMVGEYDETADEWLWMEVPLNEGDGMLEHVALDTNDIDSDTNTTEYRPYAIQEDFQHTVCGLNDTDPSMAERYRYSDPYGVTNTEDAGGTGIGEYATEVLGRKRLHGGVVDARSESYDFRNRWLLPQEGVWTSPDPWGFIDSWNMYQAFLARPSVLDDAFGLTTVKICGPGGGYWCEFGPNECAGGRGRRNGGCRTYDFPHLLDYVLFCCPSGECKLFRNNHLAPGAIICRCSGGSPSCTASWEITFCCKPGGLAGGAWGPKGICKMCDKATEFGQERPDICKRCCPPDVGWQQPECASSRGRRRGGSQEPR